RVLDGDGRLVRDLRDEGGLVLCEDAGFPPGEVEDAIGPLLASDGQQEDALDPRSGDEAPGVLWGGVPGVAEDLPSRLRRPRGDGGPGDPGAGGEAEIPLIPRGRARRSAAPES